MEQKYDNKYLCKECQGENEILITATDGGYISECDTICKECKQKDYWAYGFYQH